MRKLLFVVMFFALVFLMTACEKVDNTVLHWNIGADPLTLDPTLNGASDGGDVINQTFEGLVRETSGNIKPGIAKTWDTSADAKKITFHLRESKWSDGSDLTAYDFVYAWLRGMDPRTASEYSWIWEYSNIVGALDFIYADTSELEDAQVDPFLDDLKSKVGISAPDAYTLVVELVAPTPYFVSLMSFYHFMPIKQSSVEDPRSADVDAKGLWAKIPALAVCNGPFKLEDYNIGDGLILVKNENYWNAEVVKLEKIEGEFIADANTAFAALNSGALDIIPDVPPTEVPRLIAEDSQFKIFPLLGTYYMNFNLDRAPWNNAKLRKALAYGIDRDAICDALGAGQRPAGGFVAPGFLDDENKDFFEVSGGYGMPTDDSKYGEAATIFAEAATELGYANADALKAALKDKVILYNTGTGHETVAQMIQEQWKQALGIEVVLQNQEWAVFQETRKAGDYDISRGGWLTDFMDPAGMLAIFTTDNAYNDPNYSNTQFDQLMSEAQSTTDIKVHFDKLYEAQQVLINDMPILPIYHYTDPVYIKDYVKGWDRSVLGSLDFTEAYLKR